MWRKHIPEPTPCEVPEFKHNPVMLAEVLNALQVQPGRRYVDGTLGGGGHAAAMLEISAPSGWVFGCDRDGVALEAARLRLSDFSERFECRRGNFADLAEMLPPDSVDGVLLDLGVSSPQLNEAGRGFSFQQDGPLDMRMDVRQELTAADVVNREETAELARIFAELGDEPHARRIARAIVEDRQQRPFRTTRQLAGLIERVSPRRGARTHPATKVFLALRLVVNEEPASLRRGLEGAVKILKSGGRLAVITFHSLEDRLVKVFGRERTRDYEVPEGADVPELRRPRKPELTWVSRKALKPGMAEIAANPRSRSAQLRILEKN
jgi:16S rRNA (cytosine1402-N4)-methyltransferase